MLPNAARIDRERPGEPSALANLGHADDIGVPIRSVRARNRCSPYNRIKRNAKGRNVPQYGKASNKNSPTAEKMARQRLDAAVKRFIESSRQHNGKREARLGLTTTFQPVR